MRPRLVIFVLLLLIGASIVGLGLRTKTAPPSGLVDGRLRPCPETPACLCSQDEDSVAPLIVKGDPDLAFAELVGELKTRHELLLLDDVYAHFECSSWLGIKSDLELWLDRPKRVIQVRSSSRIGQGGHAGHERRIDALRAELADD